MSTQSLKENLSLDIDDYIVQKQIGEGSFGKVFIVKEKKTGKLYAAKISFEKINESSEDTILNLSREVNIIAKLNHPSIIKFIGFSPINFRKKPKPVILTEFASNGSLNDLIKAERHSNSGTIFNSTLKLIIIYGIATAMSYLHKNDIIHRDLKPANILLNDFLFPKIADFGLSKIKSDTNDQSIAAIKGTPIYISPEIWVNMQYIKASDVYAFGLILYEIMTNEVPFKNFSFLKFH